MRVRCLHPGLPVLVLVIAMAVLTVLAGCGASTHAAATRTPPVTVRPTTTATGTATATTATSKDSGFQFADPATLGWVKAGAPVPDVIAAAPGAPGTLYTCTGAGASSPNAQPTITLSTSTDDGASWQTRDTGIPLARCLSLSISPTSPQSIALYAGTCRSDCGQGYERLYLTTDGGHWRQISPAPDSDGAVAIGWVGTTFFASTAPNGTPPSATQFLAVSRDGVHFTWTSLPVSPGSIFTSGSTLYVVTGSTVACAARAACADLYASSDLGASWSRITPTYQGHNVAPVAISAGGTALLGVDARALAGPNTYPLLRSVDGGATWQPLPDVPGGLRAGTAAPVTVPDGTIYEMFCCGATNGTPASGIYTLAPGSLQWVLVSPVVPAQIQLIAVSWDTRGHPAKLWGLRDVLPNTSASVTSLWSHSA